MTQSDCEERSDEACLPTGRHSKRAEIASPRGVGSRNDSNLGRRYTQMNADKKKQKIADYYFYQRNPFFRVNLRTDLDSCGVLI
jgi:hypothetical protein